MVLRVVVADEREKRFSLNFFCVSGPRYRPPCLPALPTSGVSSPPPEQPSRLPPDLLQIASVSAILFLGFGVRACSATSGRFPVVVAAECRTVQEQRIQDEILVLEFSEVLPLEVGVLAIGFEGTLNDKMKGFYRSTFEHNGEKRNMAVTQFEPADARRCFPCWDEPACKATFKITLDMPSDLIALSNMPVIEEKTEWASQDSFLSRIANYVYIFGGSCHWSV
ncbi:hypothetical protein VitviT2T_026521 [Vitis vinifera]|uniref:Aminopeptidase N-like N-terminal domain-containing protein n=1 Tax=Vitis vinifera TaxID=29760 RepID=A0ABY9DR07_VITVI|nr:hypothetical protein VitviT2T_026521 [Vitis vinifera]